MEGKEFLRELEERLIGHDKNRKEVQDDLKDLSTALIEDVDSLEEEINKKLQESFNSKEDKILKLVELINNNSQEEEEDGISMHSLVSKAQDELTTCMEYEILHMKDEDKFTYHYKLDIPRKKYYAIEDEKYEYKFSDPYKLDVPRKKYYYTIKGYMNEHNFSESYKLNIYLKTYYAIKDEDDAKVISNKLLECLNEIRNSMIIAQEKITEICTQRRNYAEKLGEKVGEELEPVFTREDERIQELVKLVKENSGHNKYIENELMERISLGLLVSNEYSAYKDSNDGLYHLNVTKKADLKWINSEGRKPTKLFPMFADKGGFLLSFTFFRDGEVDTLKTVTELPPFNLTIKIWEKGNLIEEKAKTFTKTFTVENQQVCLYELFKPITLYCLKIKVDHPGILFTEWSDSIEFTSPGFNKLFTWKECPDKNNDKGYSINVKNPRIVTKKARDYCTVIGNTLLLPKSVNSWHIKVLESEKNDGNGIYIGVVPFDTDQDIYNFLKYGWYFSCYDSTLYSGPPHDYNDKAYGPRKVKGQYVHTGESIGVVMDTAKGELSFVLNGVNYGVAYEGIPLDKPFTPCVLLGSYKDSIEFDTAEVKGVEMDSFIPFPSNITTKSKTWDSITLTWDAVEGGSLYQIEVDENKNWFTSTTNSFMVKGFLPDSEHIFRMRTVIRDSVSEWSDVIKAKTQQKIFEYSGWKESPVNPTNSKKKYLISDDNSRIATNDGFYVSCAVIGNTRLPRNEIVSWSIKVLTSQYGDGDGIYIGVAPSDINRKEISNLFKYGWYYYCSNSMLLSGPPHNYINKEYGPKKERFAKCCPNEIGVIMDTTKGELSFIVDGVNRGVAYERIPLGKPLVPCVLLKNKGDSVELVI